MKVLDSLQLPLHGQCLIEASAGTGKTYTICTLVLRLLLGHASGRTGVMPRTIEQILIVTFTRAATEELRGRIRSRLRTALRVFDGDEGPGDDQLLEQLLSDSSDRKADRERLALAQASLDLASVFTIHGFASRMLERHAFESRASFAAQIADDDEEIVSEAIRDFWRQRVYPLAPAAAVAVLDRWSADGFIKLVHDLMKRQELQLLPLPSQAWDTLIALAAAQTAALLAWWQEHGDDARIAVQDLQLKAEPKAALAESMAALDTAQIEGAALDRDALEALSPAFLEDGFKKQTRNATGSFTLPDLALFALAGALLDSAAALTARLLYDAVIGVRERLNAMKALSGKLGYEDLLRLLDEGLSGAGGERLAAAIRQQYPVALIDEFQDTDPLQWRVFERVYATGEGALFLVGDPKQAIYAFRGADVHAYLKVSRDAPYRCSLDTNFRSVEPLVSAINAMHSLREDGDPFRGNGLMPYHAVGSSGQPERTPLLRNGVVVVPLQVLHIDTAEPLSTGDYRARIAVASAAHLADLLRAAARGELLLGERALRAGDIACLVRGWPDARALEHELRCRNIPTVYRGRDSVYGGATALDIYQLLAAVLNPGSESHLRAALSCALLGYAALELDALLGDENLLMRQQERFIEYAERLRRLGPQAMLRLLLFAHDVPARLLAQPDGERRLTDCLHLLELLQSERAALDSDAALLARLAQNMSSADGEKEAQRLRLESDADRVQIVTLHSAKGLEYPIVYLPFQATFRKVRAPLYHDAVSLAVCYYLNESDFALQQAEQERIAEDMRLLYVGLTRAAHCCVLGVADTKVGNGKKSCFEQTALGYLLDARQGKPADAIAGLRQLPGTCFADVDEGAPQTVPASAVPGAGLHARVFTAAIERDWHATSFSALTRPASVRAERVFRQPELTGDRSPVERDEAPSIFTFPAGAQHGSFLHGLLEQVDFAHGARSSGAQAWLTTELARNGYQAHLLPVVMAMLDDVLGCAIDDSALRLECLVADQRIAELGFELPLARLDAQPLNRLLDPDGKLPPLGFTGLQGMLSGFIDLVFEYQGRYYIADFKSNQLGGNLADYRHERLDAAMLEHRYDVQYLFYTVALQRLLRSRLGTAYDYATHIGGAYYLYLRGMRRDGGTRHGVWFRRPECALIDRLDALFAGDTNDDA